MVLEGLTTHNERDADVVFVLVALVSEQPMLTKLEPYRTTRW